MAPKGPKSILYIVMLHIKSKVMKIEYSGAKNLPRGHVWGAPEVKKSRILGPFLFYCHTTPPRLFQLEP